METTTSTQLFDSFQYFERLLPQVARTGIFSPAAQKYAREQTGNATAAYRPRAQVTARNNETQDTISLYLRTPYGYPAHKPGQHIDVAVEINGTRHVRQYSVTSACGECNRTAEGLRITIKRQNGGRVSQYIHDHIDVGATLEISAPRGTFTLPDTDAPAYIFCSAGSGITPVFAMVRSLLASGTKADVFFYHAARSADAVIFRAELEYLAEQYENFYPHFFFSEATEIKPRRLNFSGLQPLLPLGSEMRNAAVFICGPGEFVKNLEIGFTGFGTANIQTEYYTLPKVESSEGVAHFRGAGITATAQGNLLEAAEAAGLKPKHGCRRGICHECKAHKRVGTVKNLLTGKLTSGEEDIQLCISQPVGAVEIDL